MTAVKPRLRITSLDGLVHNATIIYIDEKGVETDISRMVNSVGIELKFGHVACATLSVIAVETGIELEAANVMTIVNKLGMVVE